jgi:single-stranded-DNA-specific exonuclease
VEAATSVGRNACKVAGGGVSSSTVIIRTVDESARTQLIAEDVHPLMARIFASRGIDSKSALDTSFVALLPFTNLSGCAEAARLLADAIANNERLLIVADYDADGATACALGVSVLQQLGADIGYLVPNRFEHGYGLTPEIVELAAAQSPRWIITVDNGIASVDGVARANELGIRVLVTDHHLPGDTLPQAACIVNPNQAGDLFESKNLAGVGVMFYVLLALRAVLRQRDWFAARAEPNLADQLDLVALGTVADVVSLDANNRTLVTRGLERIRKGRCRPGIDALFRVAGRDPRRASSYDLGFAAGPRLNAAGRLTDMTIGIECLLSKDMARADELAGQLDALNRERRALEAQMQTSAIDIVDRVDVNDRYALSLYDDNWHHGVVGILASRLRERFHRPVFAFAPSTDVEAKGSGRSIPGLHLRDALDLVSKRYPDLILKFGGHAMAAGLSIRRDSVDTFANAFEQIVRSLLGPNDLEHCIEVDGSLAVDEYSLEVAELLEDQVWGQGFVSPKFCDVFDVLEQRVVGGNHRKLQVRREGNAPVLEAMRFGDDAELPNRIECVYRLQVNAFRGVRSPQLVLESWTAV